MRRVARELESDRMVLASRAPRLIRELFKTLCIMCGDLRLCQRPRGNVVSSVRNNQSDDNHINPPRRSSAECDKKRDEARQIFLRETESQDLSHMLASKVQKRLSLMWERVSEEAARWIPDDDIEERSGSENNIQHVNENVSDSDDSCDGIYENQCLQNNNHDQETYVFDDSTKEFELVHGGAATVALTDVEEDEDDDRESDYEHIEEYDEDINLTDQAKFDAPCKINLNPSPHTSIPSSRVD